MLNAVRVFTRYLKTSAAARGSPRFTDCCKSLVVLADFFRDAMRVYPRWCKPLFPSLLFEKLGLIS